MKFIDEHLKRTGWKFIAGNSFSLADFVIYSETWDFWYWRKPELVAKYSAVLSWFKSCMS